MESDLAGRLGVSKTPVREALALLEADGLVEATPYRGAIVRWLSMNESTEQGYLVDALEMPAYPMVIERITKPELAAVGKVVDRLKRARKARDQRQFSELAGEIHERLFACTGYPRLLALIHQVLGPGRPALRRRAWCSRSTRAGTCCGTWPWRATRRSAPATWTPS